MKGGKSFPKTTDKLKLDLHTQTHSKHLKIKGLATVGHSPTKSTHRQFWTKFISIVFGLAVSKAVKKLSSTSRTERKSSNQFDDYDITQTNISISFGRPVKWFEPIRSINCQGNVNDLSSSRGKKIKTKKTFLTLNMSFFQKKRKSVVKIRDARA